MSEKRKTEKGNIAGAKKLIILIAILTVITMAIGIPAFTPPDDSQERTGHSAPLPSPKREKVESPKTEGSGETKKIDVDGTEMTVDGDLTPEELEKIKQYIPKGNDVTVSVQVIRMDGEKGAPAVDMTPEEQKALAMEVRTRLKEAISKMKPEQREKMRDALNSPEGRKALRNSIMTYNKQLTGEERKEVDPAFQAILSTLAELKREKE